MSFDTELRSAIKGRVVVPGDEDFDRARRPWNIAVDQPVRAVVEAADAADVATLVRHAKLAGVSVTAQPTGHGTSGATDGLILLRTGALDGVEIRPEERVARVGAGVQWGAVQEAASPHGLTGLAGSSPVVGVTGYTLGGGLSWFSRKYGFAADSVRSFDIVDADGAQATVTADSDPDLFWALRGGGGDFALVTAIEFDLYPAPHLYGGTIMWPADRTAAAFAAYREVTAGAPEELSVWFNRVQFPGGAPPMVAVEAAFLGTAEEGAALLTPFDKIDGRLSDSRDVLTPARLSEIANDPTDPSPGLARTELLTELTDDVAATLLDGPIDPLLAVQLRHLGGALARPGADAGAGGHLTEQHLLYLIGLPVNPEVATALRNRQQEIADALVAKTTGRKPFTFLAPGERAAAAVTPDALARLRAIKRDRDPRNTLRSNFPVNA